jgi:hypothetical protein
MLRCVVADWHLADILAAPEFVRFWTEADIGPIRELNGLSANDPKRTK